ncbi:hypothetical protein M885DRAFT_506849 [Pelagophyceae sp. CCMP2097]|nr:hypothetical protein M885DRAFT_506849 [Pelagophyceae sp. CCMP2097]
MEMIHENYEHDEVKQGAPVEAGPSRGEAGRSPKVVIGIPPSSEPSSKNLADPRPRRPRGGAGGDFSSMYARVKGGDGLPARPFVARQQPPTAVCKRCGAKVAQAIEAIEGHEAVCSGRGAAGEGASATEESITADDATRPSLSASGSSFSNMVRELPQAVLHQRLASEGRTLFEEGVGDDGGPQPAAVDTSGASSTSAVGWQRFSVAFGQGRMGLEFEYDARESRRLVVTCVSSEAAALGVRARDVLIGIGSRTVPAGTDPLAVHRHLLGCARPVALHFYRLHARRGDSFDGGAAAGDDDDDAVHAEGRATRAVAAAANLLHNMNILARFRDRNAHPADDAADDTDETPPPEPRIEADLAIPQLKIDRKRYLESQRERGETLVECDREADTTEDERCLATPLQRLSIARALPRSLRPRPWELLYDSRIDGMSLECLYMRSDVRRTRRQPQLLFIRDDHDNVAGAFVDEPIRLVGDYYGTGECFTFELVPDAAAADAAADAAAESGARGGAEPPDLARVYRWVGPYASPDGTEAAQPSTHCGGLDDDSAAEFSAPPPPPIPRVINDMFVYATSEVLGFGSGGGGFAIRLDKLLEFGASRPCETYGNTASLFGGREHFAVESVQIWTFGSQWI